MKLYLRPNVLIQDLYENHSYAYSGDSGLDIFFPEDVVVKAGETKLIDLQISCEMRKYNLNFKVDKTTDLFKNTSYMLMPRSSIYKTPLRMSNSIGLIDSSYRNTLKVPVDNIDDKDYNIMKGDRLFQIVAPNLDHFDLVVCNPHYELSKSSRGEGFGSSNK